MDQTQDNSGDSNWFGSVTQFGTAGLSAALSAYQANQASTALAAQANASVAQQQLMLAQSPVALLSGPNANKALLWGVIAIVALFIVNQANK